MNTVFQPIAQSKHSCSSAVFVTVFCDIHKLIEVEDTMHIESATHSN